MPFAANVVSVLIASPNDVAQDREALRQAMWDFNDEHASALQVVLLPVLWETHSRAELGTAPQDLLDKQIVDSADVVIGVFWTRIGSPLPDGVPATVHELERSVEAGKPVMLYFSNLPASPLTIDTGQVKAVQDFKQRANSWGIYRAYDSVNSLVEQVKRDLLRTVRDRLHLPTPALPAGAVSGERGPRPVATVEKERVQKFDSKGRPKVQTHTYLVLQNDGDATAENVECEWVAPVPAPEGWTAPMVHDLTTVEYLAPGAPVRFPVFTTWASTLSAVLKIRWTAAGGDAQESLQTIRF
ncbi:hypothetical protein [Lentzea sp. E54]|uniref:hypothetical protein n=1 Tax=Lentzea xerophila TaxID=3435883 RepID=UPI003DA4D471